ncbi:polypeptide N-acetylgalactosaminyltransferase 5-like isoform X1 [Haliotis rubra]|uniref:polypeptide N-acetylgalactosaminyltransferase 5-like isoform X1 n=1 Tax=Haliotis rubra TaxID=36100 RepID=UPI001EE5EB14|nr:polypeptide N-acetylgalactosaminyltransferase 5-like isoform X1 [Haliotis rubra]
MFLKTGLDKTSYFHGKMVHRDGVKRNYHSSHLLRQTGDIHQNEITSGVTHIQKDLYPEKAAEQRGQQTQNTYKVEYYVEEYGGEDSNETYPPFVEYSPEDGPGEWGVAFRYPPKNEEMLQWREGVRRNRFDQMVSDRISVHRRLPDRRLDECKSRVYPADLPPASVIICFHNEAWSTLLRSVHSVLDRSPGHLIREIILVDDASTQEHLKNPLKKYMSKLGKTKLVRMKKHQGLIRARLVGYELATGPTLVFLDSHIECFPGWLEPLLSRIRENPRTVTIPMIDVISSQDFGTGIFNNTKRLGVFRWKLLTFHWEHVSKHRRSTLKTPTDPIRSPTMPGGLFAIDKKWFTTLGTYDPGLSFWGGENMELSLKTWMCNGTLELLPCSHVGHIFRRKNPVKWKEGGNPILTNSLRVAEVWLDEYKHLFYEQTSLLQGRHEYGDISDRKKLRDSLHCHDFRWYIENVYPEIPLPVLLNVGEVRSSSSPALCLDTEGRKTPSLVPCHGQGGNQYWKLYPSGMLQSSSGQRLCVMSGELTQDNCFFESKRIWTYTGDKDLRLTKLNICLTVGENSNIFMTTCNGSANQKWIFEKSKFRLKTR